MSDYPEHDKLRAAKRDSQVIGEFLSWLAETHRAVCEPCPAEGYVPITLRTEQLLAEYFNIDLTKIEDERQAMLKVLREQHPPMEDQQPSGQDDPPPGEWDDFCAR